MPRRDSVCSEMELRGTAWALSGSPYLISGWSKLLAGQRAAAFDLLEGLVDEALVVFLREVPLDDLRRDHHREVDGFVADLLERPCRLELNLALGIADDPLRFLPRLLADLLAQPFAVGAASPDDGVRLDARLPDDLRRLLLQALQLLLRPPRVVERFADRLLALVERVEQRPPRKLRQQRQQHEERDDGPDEKPGIGLDQRIVHISASFQLSAVSCEL